MRQDHPVNYIYFGALFIIFSFLHIYHVFLIEHATFLQRGFYVIYALGQCFLETTGLIIVGYIFSRWFPKGFHTGFVVMTFLLFLAHLIDFSLVRIMGMSIWFGFDFIRDESLGNFLEMLYATHISMISWISCGLIVIIVPLLGVFFFRFTDRLSRKKPVSFSYPAVGMSLFTTLFFLSVFDFSNCKSATPADEGLFLKALPWKTTLFSKNYPKIHVGSLLPKLSENEFLSELETIDLQAAKKPNIFLFIIESLREDFVKKDVAPFLTKFREENIAFRHSQAAANYTHMSWFSIFHSSYPFYWNARQPSEWRSGSLPLQILKKAGYQVHVYSASRLKFYQMDERLFGKGCALANTIYETGDDEPKENYENDADCLARVAKDAQISQEGNVFIVFLESTHFGYSWPQDQTLYPADDSVNYLNIACSNGSIKGVKNRYRNAIHFIDGLLGNFVEKLDKLPRGKEAAVVITGDHGEEFFEQGRIFHASNLSSMQTHVPIYYRLGALSMQGEISSHLDIFPTLLHHVLGDDRFESWFDGESILRPRKKNFTISARFNANRNPFEFLIHNGKKQLIARFEEQADILKSRALQIISHRDSADQSLETNLDYIQQSFKGAFNTLFID